MKKNLKKLLILSLTLSYIFVPTTVLANGYDATSQPSAYASSDISTYSDEIVWQYKAINGKLYRRLYNSTQNIWYGEWELVK